MRVRLMTRGDKAQASGGEPSGGKRPPSPFRWAGCEGVCHWDDIVELQVDGEPEGWGPRLAASTTPRRDGHRDGTGSDVGDVTGGASRLRHPPEQIRTDATSLGGITQAITHTDERSVVRQSTRNRA